MACAFVSAVGIGTHVLTGPMAIVERAFIVVYAPPPVVSQGVSADAVAQCSTGFVNTRLVATSIVLSALVYIDAVGVICWIQEKTTVADAATDIIIISDTEVLALCGLGLAALFWHRCKSNSILNFM
jgi:hypothetical protein